MVGSSIHRKLIEDNYLNILTKKRSKLDLTNQKEVDTYFKNTNPEYVFLAAAIVGGIDANRSFPADFIYKNLMIQNNIIEASRKYKVKKILFLGSSCIYPKMAPQPMREEYLLSGPLEETNIWYAVAKIAGIKLVQAYNKQHNLDSICAMPTNLFGPNDNYDLKTSHVLPALLRKFHEAKINNKKNVEIWGTGKPRREFLYVEDLSDALIFLMKNDVAMSEADIFNIGYGSDITIKELAKIIADVVNYKGNIFFNENMPDGTKRKLLDSSKINKLGWKPKFTFEEAVKLTYRDFLKNYNF